MRCACCRATKTGIERHPFLFRAAPEHGQCSGLFRLGAPAYRINQGEAFQGAKQNSPTPPSPSNALPEAEVVEEKAPMASVPSSEMQANAPFTVSNTPSQSASTPQY
jgi:hypothetical protein